MPKKLISRFPRRRLRYPRVACERKVNGLSNMSEHRESIIIVDENDEIIGHKERGTLLKSDIYRVTALWVTNSRGDILLAQRALTKRHDPGKWGPAAAGTVDQGETYDGNVVKEAFEELGLAGIRPTKGPRFRVSGEYQYFCQLYLLVVDRPAEDFVIQAEEVAQVRWFSKAELETAMRDHPEQFLDGLKREMELVDAFGAERARS